MNKYILGNKIIETTEERYNSTFKGMGYIPYVEIKKEETTEKEIVKEVKRRRKSIKED